MPHRRGYLLGRLFALLALQGALEQPAEQLYRLASTSPPQVIPRALATLIENGKEESLLPLMKHLPPDAFDGPLNRREQGAYAIGYGHERGGYPLPLQEEERDEEEQELTERYEIRVDPRLKEWIKLKGGGTFIRAILRSERTKAGQEMISELLPDDGGGR